MAAQYTEEFKNDAVRYWKEHPGWLNRFKIKNYGHAYKLVFEYIETFYNTVRIHSHCGYLSPNEYENVYEQKLNKMEKLAG